MIFFPASNSNLQQVNSCQLFSSNKISQNVSRCESVVHSWDTVPFPYLQNSAFKIAIKKKFVVSVLSFFFGFFFVVVFVFVVDFSPLFCFPYLLCRAMLC